MMVVLDVTDITSLGFVRKRAMNSQFNEGAVGKYDKIVSDNGKLSCILILTINFFDATITNEYGDQFFRGIFENKEHFAFEVEKAEKLAKQIRINLLEEQEVKDRLKKKLQKNAKD